MAQITVTRQADGSFRVQTPAGTSHEVSVPAGFPVSLGCVSVVKWFGPTDRREFRPRLGGLGV